MSVTVERFRSTSVASLRVNKDLASALDHEPGQRTFTVKVDSGMRPAQLPVGDVPCRYEDDDFEGIGMWHRIPEELDERMTEVLDTGDPDYYDTFIERLTKLLDHYEKTKEETHGS